MVSRLIFMTLSSSSSRTEANSDPSNVKDSGWWTFANVITVVRLLLIPPATYVLVSDRTEAAIALLVVFGATDRIDGWVARRFKQVSRLGTVLDPIADRLGIAAILVALTLADILPWWLVAAVLVTDVVVGLTWLVLRPQADLLVVTRAGKARTALLMVGLVGAAAQLGFSSLWLTVPSLALLGSGVVLHIGAGIGYLRQMMSETEVLVVARDRTG
jgi:cardiolipin synthase (CMP-forming)